LKHSLKKGERKKKDKKIVRGRKVWKRKRKEVSELQKRQCAGRKGGKNKGTDRVGGGGCYQKENRERQGGRVEKHVPRKKETEKTL